MSVFGWKLTCDLLSSEECSANSCYKSVIQRIRLKFFSLTLNDHLNIIRVVVISLSQDIDIGESLSN